MSFIVLLQHHLTMTIKKKIKIQPLIVVHLVREECCSIVIFFYIIATTLKDLLHIFRRATNVLVSTGVARIIW